MLLLPPPLAAGEVVTDAAATAVGDYTEVNREKRNRRMV
jgi:hypothetical protein